MKTLDKYLDEQLQNEEFKKEWENIQSEMNIIRAIGEREEWLKMSGGGKLKEVHEAYEHCRKVFEPSAEIIQVSLEIEDKDEFEFYRMVHNYFMRKKQMELVEKGVY